MDPQTEREDRIQAYLDRELDADERSAFEQELNTSPELAQRLAQYQEARLQIQAVPLHQLGQEIKDWARTQETPRVFPLFSRRWLSVAAILLLLTCLMGAWLGMLNAYQTDALYAQYEDYSVQQVRRKSESPYPPGTLALEARQFRSAVNSLNNWRDTTGQPNPEAHLYLAKAYLGLHQPDSALSQLDQLESLQQVYDPQLDWYRALALLQQEKPDSAVAWLDKVIQNGAFRAQSAAKLKRQLQSPWYRWAH